MKKILITMSFLVIYACNAPSNDNKHIGNIVTTDAAIAISKASGTSKKAENISKKHEPIFLQCTVKKEDLEYDNAESINVDFQIRHGEKGWELGIWKSWGYEFEMSYVNIDPYFSQSRIGNVAVDDDSIVIDASKDAGVLYGRQVISRYDGSWSWYYDTGSAVRAYRTSGLCNASKDQSLSRKF